MITFHDIEGNVYDKVNVTWAELIEGDVIVLPTGNGVPIKLVHTCRNCASPELWNQVCACHHPDCPRTIESVNVRTCLAQPGVWVFRLREEAS